MNLGSFNFSRCPKDFYFPNLVEPPCLLGGNVYPSEEAAMQHTLVDPG